MRRDKTEEPNSAALASAQDVKKGQRAALEEDVGVKREREKDKTRAFFGANGHKEAARLLQNETLDCLVRVHAAWGGGALCLCECCFVSSCLCERVILL